MKRSGVVRAALEVLLHIGTKHLVLGLDADEKGVVLSKDLVGAVLVPVDVVEDLSSRRRSQHERGIRRLGSDRGLQCRTAS